MYSIDHPDIITIVDLALREDIGSGDITTQAIYTGSETATGIVMSRQEGVIAGIELARLIAEKIDDELHFTNFTKDGDLVADGQNILKIEGSAASILTAERTMLNFMQRMSGIATSTRFYTKALSETSTRILDTRKTVPGNRLLDKWAVQLGGGVNHRLRLDDMFLIKENHIAVAGGIKEAVKRCAAFREKNKPDCKIEVEVRDLDELSEALETSLCDFILLDNMSDEMLRQAVIINAGRSSLEASGNMTIDRVLAVANTGVDFISVGALTHSTKALDLSMLFQQ
ncbi:MAG: carboxylating nicotinate-nucleotide diphosphorylase [Balneolaceae bacterium]|nr:MAG: carboxylating nicotinate-nucleotide diphosphorylase [Balneolaceae bacterium]